MHLKLFVALVGLVLSTKAAEENYCDPTLCEDGLTHTACDHYLVRTKVKKSFRKRKSKKISCNRNLLKSAARILNLLCSRAFTRSSSSTSTTLIEVKLPAVDFLAMRQHLEWHRSDGTKTWPTLQVSTLDPARLRTTVAVTREPSKMLARTLATTWSASPKRTLQPS